MSDQSDPTVEPSGGQQYDDPNREALGLDPAGTGAGEPRDPDPEPEPTPAPAPEPEPTGRGRRGRSEPTEPAAEE